MMNFFIGPMSKNVVDSVLEFSKETGLSLTFIPSRRQVEYDGGYVNNWTTKEFSEYVKSFDINIKIVRDHSGPSQGQFDDDGYKSLECDCKYFDLIHIDPWKKYSDFDSGLSETIRMINFCYGINPKIEFEVGTEQSIRNFNITDLSNLVNGLKNKLDKNVYSQIKYLVIQSGTSLKGTNQTGNYDKDRLIEMVNLCKKENLLSKEHNGDYIDVKIIKEKFDLGLDSINIAPEFGVIETNTYLELIKDSQEMIDTFFQICYDSKKWVKWVDDKFNPFDNKLELIKICGHYILSNDEFVKRIKSNLIGVDEVIKNNLKNKLFELHGL